jgi:hypothetical protein
VSFYLNHHFTKRFDAFAGVAYPYVSEGLAIAIPHGPGVLLTTTATLLQQSVVVSPSDRPKRTSGTSSSRRMTVARTQPQFQAK